MFDVAPWKPLTEITRFRKEMDRLWEDFFGGKEMASPEMAWVPAVDVSETDDSIVVKAEVPGMEAKDIEISFSGDTLRIKGEKKQESEEKKENYHRIETRYGAFSRSIRMPVSVDPDKIEAKYDKGVLKIVLKKKEEAKPKQIEVKTS